ncbi:unnamed protein product [Effrenium voratum]|uniref:Protein kinase domain-containing protein n=1 Tax=Effrenium voratum TaxID=2562239 RepID=A0AA36ILT8_9DINO|nr:unnamed protein product [Effrenium voratum]
MIRGPQLVYQQSVPQIAQAPPRAQHVHVQPLHAPPQPRMAMPFIRQQASPAVYSAPCMPFRPQADAVMPKTRPESVQPSYVNTAAAPADFIAREDLGMAGAGTAGVGANHAQNGWSVSNGMAYARVPSYPAKQAYAPWQPATLAHRRSACVLRPELLSARREAAADGSNTAPSAGLSGTPSAPSAPSAVAPGIEPGAFTEIEVATKNEAGMLQIPDVRPKVQPTADATLLSVWPGLGDADFRNSEEHPEVPQKARGQLTSDEKLAYSDLKFVEHLGSGEFGQVFRGFYKKQEVAIKQLYWDNTVLPQVIIQDLTREIESFRHLRHKRLVNFVGACLEIPNLCIVTEYAPGGSLHHLLHVRKLRLPLLHCANMCLQLAEGVVYLHSQNPIVVHRDLKSLNVVLDLSLNLKLCDFGLTESMERTHITKKNNGGSPRYMAPELFDSKSKITEKVDIWSMGCIFTEINGGPLPYEGINTLAELTREMLVNRRTPSIPPFVAEPLQVVIAACYNFDARLRPSARQVYDQLREGKKQLQAQGLMSS